MGLCASENAAERGRESSFVLFSRSYTPSASGTVGSGLVFLRALEAIHPFTDFGGHFHCISVWVEVSRNKNKYIQDITDFQALRSLWHTS